MGSKSTTKTEIPAYIEQGGKDALAQAQRIQQMGYVPYMGPEVAAYNPIGAQTANMGFEAFGMPTAQTDLGMPTTTMGGMTGYSSFPVMEQAQMALKAKYPGLYEYLTSLSMNPVTGAGPTWAQPAPAPVNPLAALSQSRPDRTQEERDARFGGTTSGGGGYTSIRDMFDGGGPGVSGGAFSGGGRLSDLANRVTGR